MKAEKTKTRLKKKICFLSIPTKKEEKWEKGSNNGFEIRPTKMLNYNISDFGISIELGPASFSSTMVSVCPSVQQSKFVGVEKSNVLIHN